MKRVVIFIGNISEKDFITGGERQIAEMLKGLKRNGFDVYTASVGEPLHEILTISKNYKKEDVYIITDYSKRFSFVKLNFLCKYKYRFNVVCTVGAFYFDYRTSRIKNAIDYVVSWLYLKPANLIFTTGKAVDNKLRRIGCRNKKIVNIYPAIRDSLIKEVETIKEELSCEMFDNKKIVLTVGRFHRVKGYDYLLDAAKLCLDMEDIQFVLVGDYERKPDDYYQHILKRIQEEGLEDKIILYGKTKDDVELASLYRNCWCYLHTSVWESSPITVCEPLLFNKPVIATDVGGTSEYIKNETNGILVSSKSGKSVADAIRNLYKDQALYKSLSASIETEKRNLTLRSWEDVGEEYYQTLCGE